MSIWWKLLFGQVDLQRWCYEHFIEKTVPRVISHPGKKSKLLPMPPRMEQCKTHHARSSAAPISFPAGRRQHRVVGLKRP